MIVDCEECGGEVTVIKTGTYQQPEYNECTGESYIRTIAMYEGKCKECGTPVFCTKTMPRKKGDCKGVKITPRY